MLLLATLLQKSYELDIQAGSSRSFLGWIILGLIAGWLAGKLVRGEGFGCIGDVILGLIGSVIGGWLFTKLGIVHANTFLYSLAAATVGAVILVAIAHLFFGGSKS
jgi:uncharacterized membrane protein YeaQ/YmgE (transglycosylase-associated protein family)